MKILFNILFQSIVFINCYFRQMNTKSDNENHLDTNWRESHVENYFFWDQIYANVFDNDIPMPWLKSDRETAKSNSKAEEDVNNDNNSVVSKRMDSLDTECGQSINPKVVSGENAFYGEYPWIAVIIRYGRPVCAGSIINNRWILSAAHCFMRNRNRNDYLIRIGTNKYTKGQEYHITKIIIHPRFNAKQMLNSDICLLRVDRNINYRLSVRPICLPALTFSEPIDTELVVVGWGAKSFFSRKYPIQLQEVILDIIEPNECQKRFQPLNVTIYKSQICTWSEGRDSCRGDSGAPGIQYVKGRAILIGIVSYGIQCADEYPGVYTLVSYYLNWIEDTIGSKPNKYHEIS